MASHRMLLNPDDGLIYATNEGMAVGLVISGPNPQVPQIIVGSPRATVTFSAVTLEAVCCAAFGKVNSEATATNGAHCLDRSNITAWSLTETNGITIAVGGGCASPRTLNPVTTLAFCDGVWRLRRYASDPVGSRVYHLFDGTSSDGCFPLTFTNTLVACADNGVIEAGFFTRGPNLGSGGTATVEWACCGVNTAPTAFNPATESNVSDVRDCCETYEATIGGGTIYDGRWRVTKTQGTQTGSVFRWNASKYDGRGVVIKKLAGFWFLVAENDLDSNGTPCTYTWRGPVDSECPGTEWTYIGASGCAGAPTLTVVKRNCWDGTDGASGTVNAPAADDGVSSGLFPLTL